VYLGTATACSTRSTRRLDVERAARHRSQQRRLARRRAIDQPTDHIDVYISNASGNLQSVPASRRPPARCRSRPAELAPRPDLGRTDVAATLTAARSVWLRDADGTYGTSGPIDLGGTGAPRAIAIAKIDGDDYAT